MGEIVIDDEVFCRRLKTFYEGWKNEPGWGEEERPSALVDPVGAKTDEIRYRKSTALQMWFFGYELPDTILAITSDTVHVLTSSKKAGLLEPLTSRCKSEVGVELKFHVKGKQDDGSAHIKGLINALKGPGENSLIGILGKDKPEGKLGDLWTAEFERSGLPTTDVSVGVGNLFSIKDAQEQICAKKSGLLAASAMKNYVVNQLEVIIDQEKKVKHARFSEKIEAAIQDPKECNVKLKAENLDSAYPPIVQSGGVYDLKLSAQSDDRNISFDAIMISLGSKYSMYCANIARTYMVDPNTTQEENYKLLLEAQEAAIAALVEDAPMSAAPRAAIDFLESKGRQDLAGALPKEIGFGIGLELREKSNVLTLKNSNKVKPGMVFNVALGVAGLRREDAEKEASKNYALLIADTVLVKEGGAAPEVLTLGCPKAWTEVAYYLKDDEEAAAPEPAPPPRAEANGVVKKTTLRSEDQMFKDQQADRQKQKEHQDDLLRRVNEETLRRAQQKDSDAPMMSGRKVSEVESYRTISDLPAVRDLVIQVDQRNETVLVPIYGVMVPFHILMIKSATFNQEAGADHSYIRINFNFGPGFEPCARNPNAIFLKELSFRTSDPRHAAKVVQEIKVLRSSVSQREKEQAERATLVQQEKLIKGRGRVYTLPDVWIRPHFGGKGRKMTGQLEAHANGFRYSSPKGETCDIMYRNIKHSFFQPAENEMISLVHFHLQNPIMVGKKKTKDVQFYTEVMDSVQTLDAGRRSMYDPDEIEEEQRERDTRNKINRTFQSFVRKVQEEVWGRDYGDLELDFEIPFRELGFMGVPHRQTAFVMPTVNCLVELIEMPFTVVTMAEVNIVNLERVGFNLRNFDMTLVFKDLTRDVLRIDAIPSKSLDTIREWLSSIGIKYYEGKMNLNWKPILKSIMEDPEQFIEDGGWNFLDQEGGDDEGEDDDEEENDQEFAPASDEEEESESEASSDDESLEDEDESDEDEEGSEDEDEEEGMSWDELEEEAIKEDRRKNQEEAESDEEAAGKRKKKGGGQGRPPKRGRH